jgi:uncharacterized protein YggE
MRRFQVVLMLIAVSAALATAQQKDAKEPRQRTVSVRGVGTLMTDPDQVRLTVQVNTRGESASAAMTQASAKTREILGILKTYGIDDKNIQTSRVSVAPILDYQRNIQPPPIVGYAGTNDFSVLFKGKLMGSVGDFMDKAVSAGATSFGGLVYESSRQRELERDALAKAAADARARAAVLAKELGTSLGNVMTISESVATPGPAYTLRGGMAEAMTAAAPVMTGELTINATADVVFELK